MGQKMSRGGTRGNLRDAGPAAEEPALTQMAHRILVVEDEPEDLLAAVVFALRKEGMKPIPCKDGEEALRLVKERRPDLVLLDLMLPGLDGIDDGSSRGGTRLNRQILLVSQPRGQATVENFRLVESPLPEPGEGEGLVRHHYLSLDPYMRGRMNEAASYAEPQPLGAVMIGGTAGRVVASRSERFAAGDAVVGMGGWQQYSCVDARRPGALLKVDTTHIPLSAYLGPVGMPGVTAWYGLLRIIWPRAGETVVVSAASGAVGSVVGQLARHAGCRAVGIAGGPDKCAYVVEELGFDACVDHRAHGDMKSMCAPCGLRRHRAT